jgi:8-oxo-dGTP pyrophosphatase MutT (NUDIX family)
MDDLPVIAIKRLELAFAPQPWPFAVERREEIDAYFAKLRAEKPAIWNGRVLMLHRHRIEDDVFSGACLETDFASFTAWRAWGFPDASVKNCFAMGALRGSDGGWLLGVMGPHTSAAGKIYFPSGTPDPADLVGDTVDLAGSVTREVAEETGLGGADFNARHGWFCVPAGGYIAQMKVLDAHEPAAVLRERILANLAHEPMPELADIRIVRSPADFDPMMPAFVTAFLRHMWR